MPFLDDTGVEHLVADLKEKTDASYQEKLVSGTNIKTVNNTSLLGSGNIDIGGGSGGGFVVKIVDNTMDKTAGEILTMLSNGISPIFEKWSGGYRTYIHTLSYMSIESPRAIYLSGTNVFYSYSTLDDYPSQPGGGGDN